MPRRAFIASVMKITGNVNADIGVGTRIPLKKILTWNQETRVFVSARCIRRCIREKLYEKGFKIDPLQLVGREGAQQLGDIGDPVKYIDDDIFGYLIPEDPPIQRSSPIKISHLISLRHTEIKPEFAARFQREFLPQFERGFPAPFEIEVAEWLGRLEVIISDRIGCFEENELKQEYRTKLNKQGKLYCLKPDERRERLKAFLEILLWEGWQFPRAAQSPSIPEFYYTVIALTERFAPIFGYVDVNDEGNLSEEGLTRLKELYGPLIDYLFVFNYRTGEYRGFRKSGKSLKNDKKESLDAEKIKYTIEKICEYIAPTSKS